VINFLLPDSYLDIHNADNLNILCPPCTHTE
jgi:hypothetical protein